MGTFHRISIGFLIGLTTLACVGRAANKPFWFDEIFTLAIARLPVSPEMWTAMRAGFEFNPPMLYITTHAANAIFGEGHIATRLPQILAGSLGLLLGYAVVARRAGRSAGLWFIVLLCQTPLYAYFFEARPYALVFVGTMLAYYSWQRLMDRRGSPALNYLLLFASLTFVLLSHFWAMVVPVAFCAAALALSFERRSLAWKEILVVAAAMPFLAVSASFIGATRDIVFGGQIYLPSLRQATIGLYEHNIGSVLVFVFLITSSVAIWGRLRGNPISFPDSIGLPFSELVLCFCLLIAPLFIFAVCKFAKTSFMPRYTLMSCVGGVIISSYLLSIVTRKHRILGAMAIAAVGSYLVQQAAKPLLGQSKNSSSLAHPDLAYLRDTRYAGLPIVFAQPLRFLQADFYTPTDLAQRFVYVVDRDMAIQYAETDGVDAALIKGSSKPTRNLSFSTTKSPISTGLALNLGLRASICLLWATQDSAY
jgi:hypothetical protein